MGAETKIQSAIIKYLDSKGCHTIKVMAATLSGEPDIVGCYKGMFFGIEVKTPNTRDNTSDMQKHKLKSIIKSGGRSLVAWDKQQVIDFIEGWEV